MNNTLEVIQRIESEAPAISEPRFIHSIKVGEAIRQGDIYVMRLAPTADNFIKQPQRDNQTNSFKDNPVKIVVKDYITPGQNQLVPGFTMGSRHMVEQTDKVKVLINPTTTSPIVGPVIVAKDRFTISHPQHAHFSLPEGCYGVFYQINGQTLNRVKD
jgi:hypothetical protein